MALLAFGTFGRAACWAVPVKACEASGMHDMHTPGHLDLLHTQTWTGICAWLLRSDQACQHS